MVMISKSEKKRRERICDVLSGEADCCDKCGSFNIKKEFQGNPLSMKPGKEMVMAKYDCNECGAQYYLLASAPRGHRPGELGAWHSLPDHHLPFWPRP